MYYILFVDPRNIHLDVNLAENDNHFMVAILDFNMLWITLRLL